MKTKRTEQNVKDFVGFMNKLKYSRRSVKPLLLGAGLILLGAYTIFDKGVKFYSVVFVIIGALLMIMGFFSDQITLSRLMTQDRALIEGWDIEYVFSAGRIRIYHNGNLETSGRP